MLGCCASEGDHVEVCPVTTPTSQIPVASEVTLTPSKKLEFQVNSTFIQYFLHMHEGFLVTSSSYLGVQYLGEQRVFKVAAIKRDVGVANPGCNGDLESGLLKLSLNGAEDGCSDAPNASLSAEDVTVYKITSRSKFVIADAGGKGDGSAGSVGHVSLGFSEVGGLQKQIQLLRELVLHPLKTSSSSGRYEIQFPRGILLYGPLGVGKSLLAWALAGEASPCHTLQLSAAQLLTMDSDNTCQRIFAEAREKSPSLIIIDDLNALCPQGDSSSLGEPERRAVTNLLTQLDDLHRHPPPCHTVVLATTNQLDGTPPHLRCPGRFDKEIEIPVPSAKDRVQILEVLLRTKAHSLSQPQLKSLGERAHGYVGADLHSVCSEGEC